ncbi:MAG: ATP synthase F0 subunit C [Vulcanimicrobiota bacterium]
MLVLVLPALAQDGAAASSSGMIALGAGLAISIGTLGPGLGLGNGVGKAMEAIGRNPEAEPKVKNNMIVGLAFIEALSIYALVIAFILSGNVG